MVVFPPRYVYFMWSDPPVVQNMHFVPNCTLFKVKIKRKTKITLKKVICFGLT